MTREPADRVGVDDRGRLEPGAAADLVLFDPSPFNRQSGYDLVDRPPRRRHLACS